MPLNGRMAAYECTVAQCDGGDCGHRTEHFDGPKTDEAKIAPPDGRARRFSVGKICFASICIE